MSGAARWIKKHPLETVGIATAGIFGLPALAGAAGVGAAGAAAGGGATGASAGLLSSLGGMGAEQAGILAAQNAGLGFGADLATLGAAGTAGGGMATPAGLLGKAGSALGKIGQFAGAMPQGQPPAPMMPPPPSQQVEAPTFASLQRPQGLLDPEMSEDEKRRLMMIRGMQ